ncbi:hypothetical protein T310_0769 [Rasamsonia emersonii CBS 393.64]|uniref:TauD/TfdA-like domain-containing protein n=1 Tax=Rasamsonia emersonii (strain ATCC 16479 / CBS 393.64 / IMI 116815) TaxID=1408163 RepID=A0A0F4Z5N5_RASE3|nr:hypothetical protein T310_0769 [Rasamsonia emersonii CBS 393.64]KKA25178.1 hypothetical protein T310_0769 [Rasamsonia emersonii CBS 393.64]
MTPPIATSDDHDQPRQQLRSETSIDYDKVEYKYAQYLPYYTPGLKQPPLEEFAHTDVGLRADPEKKNLLQAPGVTVNEITPNIGTELLGIQLSQLSDAQKDELALLAAERGVVVFRDQDFADIGPERQRAFGRYFGPLHVHQMGGHIKDYSEILPVYRDFVNGMGTTIFFVLDGPPSGGDTLYLSTTAAYEHLSEDFRKRISGLYATHSGFSQAAVHQHRDRYIREPIETMHPVVRTHPVGALPFPRGANTRKYGIDADMMLMLMTIGHQKQIPLRQPAVHAEDRRVEAGRKHLGLTVDVLPARHCAISKSAKEARRGDTWCGLPRRRSGRIMRSRGINCSIKGSIKTYIFGLLVRSRHPRSFASKNAGSLRSTPGVAFGVRYAEGISVSAPSSHIS